MNITYCAACGMPMNKSADFGNGNTTSETCVHCTLPDGTVRPCEEVFAGGVTFFQSILGGERSLAERLTRRNMQLQPLGRTEWQGCDCLQGVLASDTEWSSMLSKLTATDH